MNSKFRDSVYILEEGKNGENNMWEIDWGRGAGKGSPNIFASKNINELLHSPNLYGRKFDIRADCKVVDAVVKNVRPEIIKAEDEEVRT